MVAFAQTRKDDMVLLKPETSDLSFVVGLVTAVLRTTHVRMACWRTLVLCIWPSSWIWFDSERRRVVHVVGRVAICE